MTLRGPSDLPTPRRIRQLAYDHGGRARQQAGLGERG